MAACKFPFNMRLAVKLCLDIFLSMLISAEGNVTVSDDWVLETRTAELPPFLPISETFKMVNGSEDGDQTVIFTAPTPESETYHLLPTIPTLHEAHCPTCMPKFVGGDEFYRSVTKWNNLACGDSVCNKTYAENACGPFQCDACQCDFNCIRYGDCCPDIFIRVSSPKPDAKLSCISQAFIPLNPSTAIRYKMISDCPQSTALSSIHQSHAVKCHSPDPDDFQANVPVYSSSTKFHYKNQHCALCHNIHEFISWGTHAFCDALVEIPTVTSQSHLLDIFHKEDLCAVYFIPPASDSGRKCQHGAEVISTCNVTGKWQEYDADMEEACSLFVQPIPVGRASRGEVPYDVPFFQNVFCAQCNGVELYAQNSCGSEVVTPPVVHLSVIFNLQDARPSTAFKRTEISSTSCSSSYVYDPLTASCRQLFCSYGKMAENHTCVSLIPSGKDLGYILHVEFAPRNKENVVVPDINAFAQKFSQHVTLGVAEASSIFTVTNFDITFVQINQSSITRVYKIDLQFSILVGAKIPREEVETLLLSIRRRGWWWYEDASDVNAVYFDVKWLSGVSDRRLSMNPQSILALTPIGPFGLIRNFTFQFIWEAGLTGPLPLEYRTKASSYLLVNELLVCGMIQLNITEFNVTDDGNIMVKKSGEVLTTGQFAWHNNSIRVCANTSVSQEKHSPAGNHIYTSVRSDVTEVWLTIICTALSLLGLAITLVLYIVRGRQRSLPGKNSILLFANLFVAQLLFLTGSTAKVSRPGCRALGIIIHYFWLATFCWKVVCAYHMYWLLTNPLKTFNKAKSFSLYVVFSHCVPLLFIALIIAMNCGISNWKQIGYGDGLIDKDYYLCLLSSTLDLGLGFILPVALAITINIYLFFRIVKSLRNREEVHRQSSRSNKKETVVYFKMSVMFGFTWLLGFIALIVNVSGMWFLFTVVNSSIGVFVFLSFGLKNLPVKLLGKPETSTSVPTPMSSPRPIIRYFSQETLDSVTPSPTDSPVHVRKANDATTNQ